MKKHLRSLIAFLMLAVIAIPASAIDYLITFTGSGASTTVDSVVVQNLSKITQVTVPAGIKLRLYDVENAVNDLIAITELAFIYPNPMSGNATYTFTAKYAGKTQIAVFGLDGRKVTGLDADLHQGKNSFQLALPTGIYLVKANGNGFSYATKTISLSMNNDPPKISFSGNSTNTKPQRAPAPEVKLQYSSGDQLLYQGFSGNYCTIVTDKPTDTKTTDFKFVECTDTDGNHYAVVHIGTQTWMAENMKTTKYTNGDPIGTTVDSIPNDATSKYQWAYNNDENNVAKYGRLYTWYAATDSRGIAPLGWHVPTYAEWRTLEIYLNANGFNYDGSTTGYKIAKALAATTDWNTHTGTGTIGNDLTKNNMSGFTALPGGIRYFSGTFNYIGSVGYWWSSTEIAIENPYSRSLSNGSVSLSLRDLEKHFGFSVRCIKDEYISLTTTSVSTEIWDFAISGGNITNDGGSAVTARGVCWSLNPNPTINDSISTCGSGKGSFSCIARNLIADTTYYLRAFATNSVGIAYGNTVTFRTLNPDLLRGCIEANPNETGVIDSAYLNGELVYCTKINGKYIYQGDIILEDPITMNGARRKAAGINELSKRWPYNTVYYTINSNFKNTDRINNAIKEYHDKTNLKFVPRTNENNYIEFIYDKDGCFSNVGMIGNKQDIAIADWGDTRSVIHEIGHSIGLLHEQSKAGRDDFVTIIWDNIVPDKKEANFKEDKNSINTPGFDFKSIMLYDSWGFSKFYKKDSQGNKTLSPVDSTTATILKKIDGTTFYTNNNLHLSESDIILINSFYPPVNNETVTDIDGNEYHTVTIGTQTWMVENLKTTRYRNGDQIGTTSPATKNITTETEPKYQWAYDGDVNNVAKYGRLYTWYAATDSRNIAPAGWHVPTDAEWTTLENYLIANDYNYDGTTTGNKIAKSLAASTDWFSSSNTGAIGNDLTKNNRSGFSALPGGIRYSNGTFTSKWFFGKWWTASEVNAALAWGIGMNYTISNTSMDYSDTTYKASGFSVRCLRDY